MLGESDRFRFSCTSCGKCCFGQRIVLTPADVGLMASSAWARAHGIESTHDLHARGLVERRLDPDSRAPACMISVDGPDAPCPFLVPEIAITSGVQRLMVEREVAAGRNPVEAVRRAGLTPSRLLCGLHEDGSKPMVCKGAPVGRVHYDGAIQYIIEPPHPECPGMREPGEWTIAEWIRSSRLEEQHRETAWFSDFMARLGPHFPSMDGRRLAWIGEALYNPDAVAFHFGVAPAQPPSRTLPLAGLMRFVRGLAESFAAGPEEDFSDPSVAARRAGDMAARVAQARG